mmetsp:Transcript_19888/g.27569  ORF Transcript_19888/g.27569 Transcript_19888/m.27569 type:complete len:107 (+) Transcript_19888:162-482(+)|eukprot:CAMPEP_0196599046 /NCGR_PEP_ID=MMETSP1081-20130531/94649_1 /TAXON_ID=36882 /ORGANISM="Pyramimonas amylifera, Strain CCMP720" /LENGTH=106 /DNA_ID=CAMNT_0041924791 /DNA_START=1037 /DNA_END=1357 /DNA_ORIENTATION=+
MAANLARQAAQLLRVSASGANSRSTTRVVPFMQQQTRGMAGHSSGPERKSITYGGIKLYEPMKFHTNLAKMWGAVLWFWLFYRFKEEGDTFFQGHAIHFDHDDEHH